MGKEFLKLSEVEIETREFHSSNSAVAIDDLDIGIVTISGKFPCSKIDTKYCVSYINDEKITPFFVLLLNMSGYVRNLDKAMLFLVKDEELLIKNNKI